MLGKEGTTEVSSDTIVKSLNTAGDGAPEIQPATGNFIAYLGQPAIAVLDQDGNSWQAAPVSDGQYRNPHHPVGSRKSCNKRFL
jgi:hypothetical protein